MTRIVCYNWYSKFLEEHMNRVGWIIFTAVVVVLLGGLVVWARISNPPIDLSGVENNSVVAASEQNGNIGDHVKGSDANKIIFVEYGDYQCPSCQGAYPNLNKIMDQYGDDIQFVFRNFPLTTIHPNARAAAAAAEAAGLQGKFWEMHDLLYANASDWQTQDATKRLEVFSSYATSLGINVDKFKEDLTSSPVSKKINFDMALGKSVGTQATPTFFLNGEKVDDATSSGIVQGDLTAIKAKLDALIPKDKE